MYGLLVAITIFAQVINGFVIDRLYDPTRVEIPWYDKVHTLFFFKTERTLICI